MANLKDYEKLTVKERLNRYFSEEFKRKKVSELDRNLISISELCGNIKLAIRPYNWIIKYQRKKGVKQVSNQE